MKMVDKFRAYDKATKKMLIEGFSILGETNCFQIIEQLLMENPLGKTTLERIADVVIMQSTGIFDICGQGIYESDVVNKWNSRDTSGKDIIRWNEEIEHEIYGEKSSFEIIFLHHTKVLGNKYQHPELLLNPENKK